MPDVTTTVAVLIESSGEAEEHTLHNRGSAVVVVGKDGSSLSATNGFQIAPGAEEDVSLGVGEQLFAVAVSGTQPVDVL